MSSNLMDTSPGGENTQYESIKTVTKPNAKQAGQFGDTSRDETTADQPASQQSQVDTERGQKTADNVRYGQNISESGMGGMTTTSDGSANQGSGYGETQGDDQTAAGSGDGGEGDGRREAGYGRGRDMNNNIGG